jgi:hypothetical protein
MTHLDRKCNGIKVTPPRQYVLGYGSLIDQESRRRTNPNTRVAVPVMVDNLARGWWIHGRAVQFSTCFLGVQVIPGASCNGVIFPVTDIELAALDVRERNYDRTLITPDNITFLDGSNGLPEDAQVWTYTVAEAKRTVPTPQFPIVQSYVDICMNGCIEIEETYPLAREIGFVARFITDTQDWNPYWENDRIYPRRPHQFQPRAYQIDRALFDHIPKFFKQIRLQPGNWEL